MYDTFDDLQEFIALGYQVSKFNEYHYRIADLEFEIKIDIWPTKQKYWVVGSSTRATCYTNLLRDIKKCFKVYTQKLSTGRV